MNKQTNKQTKNKSKVGMQTNKIGLSTYVSERADTHFASQIILLLGTLYFKVAWYTLLPDSLCSSTHSTP